VYRSGLADGRLRFSVNLLGGPAMSLEQYRSWHERTTVGASITISFPTGQYDPARVINGGQNRWGFKPEVGLSRRRGNWIVDCYGGLWVRTANNNFYPGASLRTQSAVFNAEAHFGYYVRRGLWVSMDGNFWTGGRSMVNGVEKPDRQKNSRVGATISIPATQHNSFKLSYSTGAYVTLGRNYRTVAAAWQYSWLDEKGIRKN
jgi:Putative MetA-pathway of phenol degradation